LTLTTAYVVRLFSIFSVFGTHSAFLEKRALLWKCLSCGLFLFDSHFLASSASLLILALWTGVIYLETFFVNLADFFCAALLYLLKALKDFFMSARMTRFAFFSALSL
jgi:hypothetical protein